MQPIQKLMKKNVKFEWSAHRENAFNLGKKRLSQDPMLYHPDPNKPWIIEMDASKTAFAGVLLQPHESDGVTQEVPVMFISYSFTGMQQSWSVTERELYAIFAAIRKLHYIIYSGKVIIRTDHKPLLDIAFRNSQSDVIADNLSRLRTDEHYVHNKPLKNNEPIYLEDKAEINMVQT